MSNTSSREANRNGARENGDGASNGANGPGRHLNWSNIPVERVAEGIERQMLVGDQMMICRFRFKPFLVTPEHDHPHEQMTIVEQGKVRFFIEGKERIARAGDVLHFPSQCWHGATMMDEEVVLIDIFTPVREDFL
ncbi:MAG TPA: cupin domain-containing protein [Pyrinomonadaceae bacterium]|nr:cupin domain-containing protein [Pyrinomonadaceae bacterium]